MSSSTHLFVNWASQVSFAKCSSRSNKSNAGGSNSFNDGGNTAAYKAGIGVSKVGGIKVKCWCTTSSSLKSFTESGTKFVSNLKSSGVKSLVKSFYRGWLSWRHDRRFSESEAVSGTLWYSATIESSFPELSLRWTSYNGLVKNLSIPSSAFELSSLSKNSSSNIHVDPKTRSLPPELLSVKADKIGLFAG